MKKATLSQKVVFAVIIVATAITIQAREESGHTAVPKAIGAWK